MSGTLIFPHKSQNMIYFVTKLGMRKFCVVPELYIKFLNYRTSIADFVLYRPL